MENLKFVCPECGQHNLEEVRVNVITISPITDIEFNQTEINCSYGEALFSRHSISDSEIENYRCSNCHHILLLNQGWNLHNLKDLREWFEQNKG